jgi:hypothetical protein
VTINFDGDWRFAKFVAIGERHFNISEKLKHSQQLTCGLISRVFKVSVLFIFGSVCAPNIKILKFARVFVQ